MTSRSKWLLAGLLGVTVVFGVAAVPFELREGEMSAMTVREIDLSEFSADPPEEPVRLLFIHHSCGGQWLAPVGEEKGDACIYQSSPNGGHLRERLEAEGYEVHEASYGSKIGEDTDIFHWPVKFRGQMDDILRCDQQDKLYDDDRTNDVVMFKSCFPNNLFVGRGEPPGNAVGSRLTVENAKAAYRELLPEFEKHPDVLFVAVTAPPLVLRPTSLLKWTAKKLLARPDTSQTGEFAREFNNWLKDAKNGWLAEYDGTNVVVFDHYDVLTNHGESNFSQFGSGPDADDDHPNSTGNQKATEKFIPFLNRALRRASLSKVAAANQ